MSSEGALSYLAFYDKQIATTAELQRRRMVATFVLAVALVGLLLYLGSPVPVWVAVVALFLIALYGSLAVKTALRLAKLAMSDLAELAKFATEPRSKQDVAAWATSRVSADDSNVPEAIRDLCKIGADIGNIRVSANAAFTQPSSQLSRIFFLRTALVLGGLFGTVLFFATALGGQEILGGNLAVLLPQLRGALASTLTGILGSVMLGYFGSEIDGLLERCTWETEAFLAGSIAPILDEPSEIKIVNEVQLWTQLLAEVQRLRNDTASSYERLGNDVSAYAVGLQTVADKLSDLPAIQIPPQLSNLSDVVAEFHRGASILDDAVRTLVDAVGAVGLYFPSLTVKRLETLSEKADSYHGTHQNALSALHATIDRNTDSLSNTTILTRSAVTSLGEIRDSIDTVRQEVRSNAENSAKSSAASEAAQHAVGQLFFALKDVPTRVNETVTAIDSLARRLHGRDLSVSTGEIDLKTSSKKVDSPVAIPPAVRDHSEMDAQAIEKGVVAIQQAEIDIRAHTQSLADALADLLEGTRLLTRINETLGRLDNVFKWHERASRAPLMRFMLLPFRSHQSGRGSP
jgi:hypothetical protein